MTDTEATGATGGVLTLMETGALVPPADAVTVALPGDFAFTTPVAETSAMLGSLDVQVIARSTGCPLASRAVAEADVESPTSSDVDVGSTASVMGVATVTVIGVNDVREPLVAVIGVMPTAIPLASPVELTVATAGFPVDHVTTDPGIGVPD